MNLLSSLRLSSRLALGFGLVIALLLALASVALIGLNEMARGLRTITEVNTVRSQATHEMETAVNLAVIGMRNLGITEDNKEETSEYKRLLEALARYDAADMALEKMLSSTPANSTERALFAKVRQSAAKGREIVKVAQQEIKAKGGTPEQIAFIIRLQLRTELAKWNEAQYAWSSDLRALNAHVTTTSKEHSQRLDETSTQAQAVVVAGTVLALLLGSIASIVITRSVTVPVARAVDVVRKIARGELEEPIKSDREDEVGHMLQAFEDMRARLHQMASRLHEATDQISTASSEIAGGNMDLSGRTEKTAASLQQAASAMAELTCAVTQSAKSAVLANELAQSASAVAARGGEVVSNLVRTMDGIDASSKKIGDIIGVIDGIAFQTNILALNAAVEAARAGEQGRGFAVVASEVRSLAQRSAQAAKEIKSLIGASVSQVQTGTQFAKDAGATMVEVVGAVDRVTNIIGEITSTTSQQSTGLGQVNIAVADVDRMTQQNSALVEQSAAAAASLKEQAAGLSILVGVFKLNDDGAGGQPGSAIKI